MDDVSTVSALRRVTGDVVARNDVTVALYELVTCCPSATGCRTAGILVSGRDGGLEVLTTASDQAYVLELHQALSDEGPARRSVDGGRRVSLHIDEVAGSWPVLGGLLRERRLGHVVAAPLEWRGSAFGSLNLFYDLGVAPTDIQVEAGQTLADLAAIALVLSAARTDDDDLATSLAAGLDARAVVEQAKGVVAVQDDVDLVTAYRSLAARSRSLGTSIPEVATRAVAQAARLQRWDA